MTIAIWSNLILLGELYDYQGIIKGTTRLFEGV